MTLKRFFAGLVLGGLLASATPAYAEGTIRIAEQHGLGYLPLHVIRQYGLIEKYGKAEGIDVAVEWVTLSGGAAMNEALLSGSVDLGSAGVGPLLTIWDRTKGNANVKAIAALNSMPLFLTTTNPAVKTLKDFTDKDKIALPAPKVGIQARILQMASEQAFGEGKYGKLDKLTVALPHPDATAALLAGSTDITANLGSPPFQYQQLADPKVRKVLSSYEVFGSPHTFNLVWTRESFRTDNPKTYRAFLSALKEAITLINTDPKKAADIYQAQNKGSLDRALLDRLLADPEIKFTTRPEGLEKFGAFMFKVGAIKNPITSWKDVFFEDLYAEGGN